MPQLDIGYLFFALIFAFAVIALVLLTQRYKPLSKEERFKRRDDAEMQRWAANALVFDPLWAIYDAHQEERKALLESQHPEFVIARALAANYPDFIVTQRHTYKKNDVVPGRKVHYNPNGPSYTAAPPPEQDVPWVIVYERLTHITFKSEKLAATWLQRWTDRRAAQVAFDSNGARLGSYTAHDVDEDDQMMQIRWNERD